MPRKSNEPDTPKKDWVKLPGDSTTKSSISVMPNWSMVSMVMLVAERGVSSNVLSKPNTASIGPDGRMPMGSSASSSAV